MATTKVDIGLIDTTGTASSSTFLRGDGAWQAAGGGWEFVSSVTSSNDATIAFTNMASGYDYQYVLTNIIGASDGQIWSAQLGVAGPTYRTSSYLGTATYITPSNVSNAAADTGDIGISSNVGIGNQTNEGIHRFSIELSNPANATPKTTWYSHGEMDDGSPGQNTFWGGGIYTTAEAHTSIKFYAASGNVSTGITYQYRRALS